MSEQQTELVITEENFAQYFFDSRTHKPQRGQVMACYSAAAELREGPEKRNLVDLLTFTSKAEAATQVMRRLLHAHPRDSFRVPRQIVQDMLSGMTVEEIMAKPYKFTFQAYFYTFPEYVPKNDPHWSSISLYHVDGKVVDKTPENNPEASK
jgi:hypothetical protein